MDLCSDFVLTISVPWKPSAAFLPKNGSSDCSYLPGSEMWVGWTHSLLAYEENGVVKIAGEFLGNSGESWGISGIP